MSTYLFFYIYVNKKVKKDLVFRQTEYFARFVLPDGNCFDARAVDFREIASVIDYERQRHE